VSAFLLVHDLGTSGDKASVYDAGGSLRGAATTPYATSYPAQSCCEQDPEDWWRAVARSTRLALEQANVAAPDIAAMTFSGQMMGCVAVDAEGRALRPALIWADTRAERQARRLADTVGTRRAYGICGHRPSASYSAAKMAWVRDNEPAVYARTAAFLQAKDFILRRATGRLVTDPSDASGTNLFDLQQGRWSPELVAASGIDEARLPEVVPSTAVVGPLQRGAAAELGLLPGTPLVAGGADGSCAAVGAGVIEEGDAYLSLGSSSWVGAYAARPLLDDEMRTFTWAHLVADRYLPTGTMQTAGLSYEWISSLFAATQAAEAGSLERAAAAVAPGAGGLLFLPYLLGERSPHWDPHARAAFVGLTMAHTQAHLVRSVLEGTAMNLRTILDCFRRLGLAPSALWAVGGGAGSALYLSMLASALELPISVASGAGSATGLGAAVAAGVGIGLFDSWHTVKDVRTALATHRPEPAAVKVYETLQPVFEAAYRSLEDTNERLFSFAAQAAGGSAA
jgi:xylulokinase